MREVIARGVERRPVFRTDQDRRDFLRRLETLADEEDVRVLAYVLMDNHCGPPRGRCVPAHAGPLRPSQPGACPAGGRSGAARATEGSRQLWWGGQVLGDATHARRVAKRVHHGLQGADTAAAGVTLAALAQAVASRAGISLEALPGPGRPRTVSAARRELVIGVNVAPDLAPLVQCPVFDVDGSQSIEIDELISGVTSALNCCLR